VDLDGDDEVEDICYCTGRLLEDYSVHVTPVCVSFPKTTIKCYR
jgi:hypothetical protein